MLFVHDHVFVKKDGNYYTTGSLNDNILRRYCKWFKNFSVFSYMRDASKEDTDLLVDGNLATVSSFYLVKKDRSISGLKKTILDLKSKVKENDGVISRMSFLGVIAVHYAKKYRKPYLIEMVADPWDSLWNHSLKGKLLAPIMYFITKYYVKRAPNVLYVTSEYLQKKYPTKGKNIGISDVEIKNDRENLRARSNHIKNLNLENLVISTLANIDVKYKGQEFVIKAIPELIKIYPNLTYRLYGAGSGNRLKKIVTDLKVDKHVEFMGQVSHDKIIESLLATDVYIQPSLQEGLPRAVVEALSTGAFVLGAATGGIPELLEKSEVISRKNSKDIVSHLSKLNKKDLEEASINNFKKSRKFDKKYLDVERDKFYNEFSSKYSV